MPKSRFKLSKKHEWIINATCFEIPEPWERWDRDPRHKGDSAVNTTIVVLMDCIKVLTKGTKMQDSAGELLDKAQKVFDYCEKE